MKLKEATELAKQGKKIRRKSWNLPDFNGVSEYVIWDEKEKFLMLWVGHLKTFIKFQPPYDEEADDWEIVNENQNQNKKTEQRD